MISGRVKAVKITANSVSRTASDRLRLVRNLSDSDTKSNLNRLVKTPSVAGALRKVGFALLLSPDPITDVPGAILLGAAYVIRKKEAASLPSLIMENRKVMKEIGSALAL